MGFIILGIILAVVILFLGANLNGNEYLLSSIILLVFISGLLLGLFEATGGYKELEEVQTIELQSLSNQTISDGKGSIFYVSIDGNNTYTFYTQINSEFATKNSKAYVSNTISGNNVTVVEEENCKMPRLVEYKQDAYVTFWSFGLGNTKIDYVFYVPVGTIVHQFELE